MRNAYVKEFRKKQKTQGYNKQQQTGKKKKAHCMRQSRAAKAAEEKEKHRIYKKNHRASKASE